jgi:hypothetical protein
MAIRAKGGSAGLCVCCFKFSSLICVPSALLSTIFLVRGVPLGANATNALALVLRRVVDGVGGGEETLLDDE